MQVTSVAGHMANSLMSLRLLERPGSGSIGKSAELELRASFTGIETDTVRIGVRLAKVIGRLDGCATEPAVNPQESTSVKMVSLKKNVSERNQKEGAKISPSQGDLGGSIGFQRGKGESHSTVDQSKYDAAHVTWMEFASGTHPEWHYFPDKGDPCLRGVREVPLRVRIEDTHPSPNGVLTASIQGSVVLTDSRNAPIASPIRRWILWSLAKKRLMLHDLKLAFTL